MHIELLKHKHSKLSFRLLPGSSYLLLSFFFLWNSP